MVRDFFTNKYALFRGPDDETLEFDRPKHFEPVFFAKDVESLRGNTEA